MGHMRRFLQDGAIFAYSLGNLQDIRDRYTVAGLPTVVKSPYGNALNFDGAADYITLTAEEEYNLRFDSGAQDFSVVAWVRQSIAHTGCIIDKRDAADDGWIFYIDSVGRVYFKLNAIAGRTNIGGIADALWHCVIAVVDRSASLSVYADGVIGAVVGNPAGAAMATTIVPRIGRQTAGAANAHNGDIYAIIIYDRILTPDEVLDLATHKAFDY